MQEYNKKEQNPEQKQVEMRARPSLLRRILFVLLTILIALILVFCGLVGYLWIKEYRPAPVEKIKIEGYAEMKKLGTDLSLLSWNIGYAGLGEESDFFMDGGKMVSAPSEELVEKNLRGIESFLKQHPADFTLIQEVDEDSTRSYDTDQREDLDELFGHPGQFALNYKCAFVPYPWPPIGEVTSGLYTNSRYQPTLAQRRSLPVPFKFPVRLVNLKRCLLVTRYPTEDGKELVLINLHLEAYDDGEGKAAQAKQLLGFMQEEYKKGNYVIAGGDWNQFLEHESWKKFRIPPKKKAHPSFLDVSSLGGGWTVAVDTKVPSYRTNNAPYIENGPDAYVGVIDGFLLSPNVSMKKIETYDLKFKDSDHNPVSLEVKLVPTEAQAKR